MSTCHMGFGNPKPQNLATLQMNYGSPQKIRSPLLVPHAKRVFLAGKLRYNTAHYNTKHCDR